MCGITGFIDYSKRSSTDILKKMTDVIQHRGPDSGDYFFEEHAGFQIGLGHRRLSIIDLHAAANQPMLFKHWVIVFNGEIYNFAQIRTELEKKGRLFSTKSDTEVILQSFDEWGEKAVDRFIGMFAFMLYDRRTKKVFTVRDRTGIKPLHIYQSENLLMWASEIKSFHQHPFFKKELDLESVKSFVQLGYVPSPYSIFKNVKKQKPGTVIQHQIEVKESFENEYWNVNTFYSKPERKIEYEDAKTELKDLLVSACQYRMVSDVPVGVFLSGGYDSALVSSILQSGSSQKIKTFTIGVHDTALNEARFAKEISGILGTDHTEIYLSENEMFEQLEDFAFYFDEPFGDSSAIPTMLVSKAAKEEVTVALSADGGDELFAGYNRYDHLPRLALLKKISKIPFAKEVLPQFIRDPYNRERLSDLLKSPDAITLANTLNNPYYKDEINNLFRRSFRDSQQVSVPKNKLADSLKSMLAYDYETYLLNDILVKVDRATMRYSLEGREPLLDHRLVEFAANLPNDFKIRNGVKKYILKDIVHEYLPKEMMERPKMGFAAPVDSWLKNNLKDKLNYYLSETYINQQNIFSYEAVRKIKDDFLQNKNKYALKLWYILVFQMWYDKWMKV